MAKPSKKWAVAFPRLVTHAAEESGGDRQFRRILRSINADFSVRPVSPELPLLSVIIVAYRSRDEIGACVGSLPREMNERAVEVIVVDNSPGDGVGELMRNRYPWITYLPSPENLGFGRANNAGYARTRGEVVLFLNPDTVSNARALEWCVRRVREEGRIGLISPRLVLRDGSMDLACRRSIPTLWDGFCRATGLATAFANVRCFAGYNLTHLPVEGTYEVGAINGAFMLGRREVFAAVAPDGRIFDERFFMYGDDLDLCIRVARAGWKIVYDGRVCITHVKGVSVAKDFEGMSRAIFDANRDVYLKHFNARGSRITRWKYTTAFALWKRVALWRARRRGYRHVRPV